MDILYIVMPAYNEQDNIEDVVRKWIPLLDKCDSASKMVVADSGSSDNTHKILLSLCEEYPQLTILDTEYKEHGPKLTALYGYALDKGADYIFQTDSDNQTSEKDFDRFWENRKDYDALMGVRNKRGDGLNRKLVSKVLSAIVRLYFGVKMQDVNVPYRLMSSKALGKCIGDIPTDQFLSNVYLSVLLCRNNCSIGYHEISFENRKKGKNFINPVRIVKIGIRALTDFKRLAKQKIYN